MINYVHKRPAGLAPNDKGLRKMFRVASEIALPTTLATTLGGESNREARRLIARLTHYGSCSGASVLDAKISWRLQLILGFLS